MTDEGAPAGQRGAARARRGDGGTRARPAESDSGNDARRRRPSLDERDAFILKLIAFRRELSPRQQRMLDAMAVAAFCERPEDVGRYAARPLAELPRRRDDTPWMTILGGAFRVPSAE